MCGIFGIWGSKDAATYASLGLHALQHRGQEGCGITAIDTDTGVINSKRFSGIVRDSFQRNPNILASLPGDAAIGHVRYSTSGGNRSSNIQPLFADLNVGRIAIAHNGNLTNADTLRERFKEEGHQFHTTSDTEVLFPLLSRGGSDGFEARLIEALQQVVGAYSLLVLKQDQMIGVRDPYGVRPLCLGKLEDCCILASESAALQIVGADFIRDVEPGEMITVTHDGVKSSFPFTRRSPRLDTFEYIYFSHPDSIIDGLSVSEARHNMGRELAKELGTLDIDYVCPILDSGKDAANGLAEALDCPLRFGITRSRYSGGRTFIEPDQKIRDFGVRLKHSVNPPWVKGKRIALVDDSIVRGTNARKLVQMARDAGAERIIFCVASPPVIHPNFYGIDTPTRKELIAGHRNVEEIRADIGADELHYLSVDGMYRALGQSNGRSQNQPQFEDSVFTGDYPIPLIDMDKLKNKEAA